MKIAHLLSNAALLLAALSTARADDQADAVLSRVAAAYDSLRIFRANIRITGPTGMGETGVTTGHIKLLRPNLARVELTKQTSGATNRVLIISDGKTVWEWWPSSNWCSRHNADHKGSNIGPFGCWLDLYYDPLTAIRSKFYTRQTRYLRSVEINGARCQLVEITETPSLSIPGRRTTQFYVDYEGLVRQVVQRNEDELSLPPTTTTFDFVDIHGPYVVDPSDYVFRPPEEATRQLGAEEDATLASATNVARPGGWTPFFEAALQGRLALVRALYEKGGDTMAIDTDGTTALMHAIMGARGGSNGVANFLLDKGSDVNARDRFGRTPLVLAAKYDVVSVIEPLLTHGADVNAKDEWGDTALMNTQRGDVGAMLIAHGARVDIRDRAGQTPLTLAARCGESGLVRVLLENGADPNVREPSGATALSHAAAGRYADIVEMLRAAAGGTKPPRRLPTR